MRRRAKAQRLKTCASKITYPTEDEAWNAARILRRQKKVNAYAYSCKGAKYQQRHWHVTSGKW